MVSFIVSMLSIFSILIGARTVGAFVVPSSSSPAGIRHESLHSSSTLLSATLKKDHESDGEEASRRVPSDAVTDARSQVGVGRRGTLMTLLGGAMSFAASDALLGVAGNVLSGGKVAMTSSGIYGARWSGLYQRLASLTAKHEAVVASPELLSWISKSPAALANPELRAWMAAQRAFSKSRQVLRAAAVLEEGLAAAGAVAAAAVVTKPSADVTSESDDDDLETSVANTIPLEATSNESELSSPMKLSKADENTATATTTLKSSSAMNTEGGAENGGKEVR